MTPEGTRAGHDLVDRGATRCRRTDPGWPPAARRSTSSARRPTRARVRLARPRRDPEPRLRRCARRSPADAVRSGYLAYRPDGEDGYVSLVLVPPARVTADTAAPKEMIFVIDRSGSQIGPAAEKAKETMHWILDHMNPDDTFQIVDFGNSANVLFDRPQPASSGDARACPGAHRRSRGEWWHDDGRGRIARVCRRCRRTRTGCASSSS